MREFGISGEFIHRITIGNENEIAEEVAEQVDRFEERVEALDLEFEEEAGNGYLKYTIPYNLVSEVDEDE